MSYEPLTFLTREQQLRRIRKSNRLNGIKVTREVNRAKDQHDFLDARARSAPAGSIGASLR